MLMTLDPLGMCSEAIVASRQGAFALIDWVQSQCFSLSSWEDRITPEAALFTSMSILPKRSIATSTSPSIADFVCEVCAMTHRLYPEISQLTLNAAGGRVITQVVEADVSAASREL